MHDVEKEKLRQKLRKQLVTMEPVDLEEVREAHNYSAKKNKKLGAPYCQGGEYCHHE